ncbi:MAG: ABC transporter ATP-binding protein [Ruminococcus sp.]|nr:ABC transporter ATP-binding protein [Ruminococcus sp.]
MNIEKKYKRKYVLDSVSLEIHKGKIYGLLGNNGAGKTTLMRIITGGCRQDKGQIILCNGNEESTGEKEMTALRSKIGSLIEKPALYSRMSAWENLYLQSVICGKRNDSYIKNLLELVGLGSVGKKKVKDFSLGMKQRLGIAKALVNKPEILILDEPINGLDPMGMLEVRRLLKELNEKYNITIIISSHILSELYQLANEYIFLKDGRLIETTGYEALSSKIEEKGCSLEEYFVELHRGGYHG